MYGSFSCNGASSISLVKQIFVVFSTEAQTKDWFACNKLRGDDKEIMVSVLGKLFINSVVNV